MARLIGELLGKGISAICTVWISTMLFGSLLIVGESNIQTNMVLAFYLYCILGLITPSRLKLFHVLGIPVLTQFLHLFQKYDFPAGANSLWRLLPFILVNLYMIDTLIRFRLSLTTVEKSIVASWIVAHFLFIIISPNLPDTVGGAFLLFIITLPCYFLYLNHLSKSLSFTHDLEKCLFLLFIILALGTFGLVFFGARYKDSDILLVTRNISDTNVTMAYFLLLWPFVLLYIKRLGNPLWLASLLVLMFAGVVALSFSRGAVLLVGPYLLLSLLIGGSSKQFIGFAAAVLGLSLFFDNLASLINLDLTYSWQLRFSDFQSFGSALQKLQEASGRTDIHRLAYTLFLENPLYGHGVASFEKLGPGYREAHSMFFTILAEQGLIGVVYMYGLFLGLGASLLKTVVLSKAYWLLPIALIAYLVFVHSVGFVFVIIPSHSLTINCIAPILLICLYYYSKSIQHNASGNG